MTVITSTENEEVVDAQVRARRAQFALTMSRYLTWACVALSVPALVAWLLFQQYPQLLLYGILVLAVSASSGLYPLFHRRSQAALGASLIIISFLATIFAVPLMIPQLVTAAGIAYTVIAILSCLLLGAKNGRWGLACWPLSPM